ncbi:hypothetical protein BH23ACT3_BH23ACT3_17940 [soil metagenome]
MRIESSVTTVSWIPSEAVTGVNKMVFGTGLVHYDPPPPDEITGREHLLELREQDRLRFANDLSAWIEVQDGRIIDAGYSGGMVMGTSTVSVIGRHATLAAVSFPDIQAPVEVAAGTARFVQTVGGHTAFPMPRRVNRVPFVKLEAPTVWTTLALTIGVDGSSTFELLGASPFPRHWVYDADGQLAAKVGTADWNGWYRNSFGAKTPWGDVESPALVTAVETALERDVAGRIMGCGAKRTIRTLPAGALLTEQGTPGHDVYLLLDGVLEVAVDGEPLAEVGPGAILGERALVDGGLRTSTLRALTRVKVVVATADQIDRTALAEISSNHRREEPATS